MIKILIWIAFGLGLTALFRYAELAYLSATMLTLTVFCAVPATMVVAIQSFSQAVRRRA